METIKEELTFAIIQFGRFVRQLKEYIHKKSFFLVVDILQGKVGQLIMYCTPKKVFPFTFFF